MSGTSGYGLQPQTGQPMGGAPFNFNQAAQGAMAQQPNLMAQWQQMQAPQMRPPRDMVNARGVYPEQPAVNPGLLGPWHGL